MASDTTIGCGDNSCIFRALRAPGGQATNGGCRCFGNLHGHLALMDGSTRSNHEDVKRVELMTRKLAAEFVVLRERARRMAGLLAEARICVAYAHREPGLNVDPALLARIDTEVKRG